MILIGIRLALAPVILHFANGKPDQNPEYRGPIAEVDLALLRGAYQIKDVSLRKVEGASTTPFFAADPVDISVEWGALLHGKFVGEAELHGPRLNSMLAKSKQASQTSVDSSWDDRSQELFPLDINRFRIFQGTVTLLKRIGSLTHGNNFFALPDSSSGFTAPNRCSRWS